MSSMQWRGGSGVASFAVVMRTSVPHNEHRYVIFTLRSSPAGGGWGTGWASDRNIAKPTRTINNPAAMATAMFRTFTAGAAYGDDPRA